MGRMYCSYSSLPHLLLPLLQPKNLHDFVCSHFHLNKGFLSQFDCLISSSLRSTCHKVARRRVKKTVTESAPSNQENQPQIEEPKHFPFIDQEVERQIAAIRAMRDVEIEHLVTELRLLRSYFNGANINASLLRRLSLAYPGCSANLSVGRFGLSSDAVKTSIFGATDNWQKTGIVLEGQSDSQMLGMHDGIRTPGVTSQRQSIGMTPKTQRLPKRGEILLSVRGSPLGVYKEDNMEAINE